MHRLFLCGSYCWPMHKSQIHFSFHSFSFFLNYIIKSTTYWTIVIGSRKAAYVRYLSCRNHPSIPLQPWKKKKKNSTRHFCWAWFTSLKIPSHGNLISGIFLSFSAHTVIFEVMLNQISRSLYFQVLKKKDWYRSLCFHKCPGSFNKDISIHHSD